MMFCMWKKERFIIGSALQWYSATTMMYTSFETIHRLYKGSQCTGLAKVIYYVHLAFEVINKPH